jgi:hypothetical protein
MRYRATFLAGFAAGFAAGARAGRERYEQMTKMARRAAESPAVQQAAGAFRAQAGRLARTAGHKVTGTLHERVQTARTKVGGQLDRIPGLRSRENGAKSDNGQPFTPSPDRPENSIPE